MSVTTIETRSLLQDNPKNVEINDEIKTIYQKWQKLFKANKEDVSELDIFYAGWILANPMVRDQFKNKK